MSHASTVPFGADLSTAMDSFGKSSLQDGPGAAVREGMKNKQFILLVITLATAIGSAYLVFHTMQRQHDSAEICRVFRELGHARTIIYLDEIDVQDCPSDFRRAYATYVIEVREAGLFTSSKNLAFSKLQDAARSHGVIFTADTGS